MERNTFLRSASALIVVLTAFAGPWVGMGAAPCDPYNVACFTAVPPAQALIDCTADILTQEVEVIVTCTTKVVEPGVTLAITSATAGATFKLKPGVEASVHITVKRVHQNQTNVSAGFNVWFAQTIPGIHWTGPFTLNASLPGGVNQADYDLGFKVDNSPAVTTVLLPLVAHSVTGGSMTGSRDWLGFTILKSSWLPSLGALGAMTGLVAAAILARRRGN